MTSKLRIVAVGMFFCLIFLGCQSPEIFVAFQKLPDGWNAKEAMNFKFDNPSAQSSDVFVIVRTTPEYEFSNLFVIAKITSPEGVIQTDTLEFEMAYSDGRPMGEGLTAVKTHKLWLKESYDFNEIGVYSFDIEQAMRRSKEIQGVSQLRGITDVGLQIEKPNLE